MHSTALIERLGSHFAMLIIGGSRMLAQLATPTAMALLAKIYVQDLDDQYPAGLNFSEFGLVPKRSTRLIEAVIPTMRRHYA
jgi:hypothetical protein